MARISRDIRVYFKSGLITEISVEIMSLKLNEALKELYGDDYSHFEFI